VHHHDGRGQKLDSGNQFCHCVISQGKQKGRQAKCDSLNEQNLQKGKDSVQKRCRNVHGPPRPPNEIILVCQNAKVQQHVGANQNGVELIGREVQDRFEKFSPCRIAHLKQVVKINLASV
jgi:hypothetical protein